MLFEELLLGFRRHWSRIPGWGLSVWGAIWLFTNSGSFFFPKIKSLVEENSGAIFAGAGVVALLYVIVRLREPTQISFHIKTTNTKITVRFGDLFKCRGHTIIPVGEFFDCDIGDVVAKTSIHGQFIQTVLGGNTSKFCADVDRSLANEHFEIAVRASSSRSRRYAIGTTAVLTEGSKKYLLFVLAKTDLKTNKASADVPQMWEALLSLWSKVRNEANGETVHIPLVGGGQSGVGLEPAHLLRILLLTILVATRVSPLTTAIEVILHRSLFSKIDLRVFANDWK